MKDRDIFEKLNSLKLIQPSEYWIVSARSEILSKAVASGWTITKVGRNSSFTEKNQAFKFRLGSFGNLVIRRKPVFSAIAVSFVVFLGAAVTVNASRSSLPGEILYPIKIANENILLAVADEKEKAKIEIEQAGRRLEELTEISRKPSDVEQYQKVERLVSDFEEKINNANKRMAVMNNKGEKSEVASMSKIINEQSEKYTDILTKTKENLPKVVKEKVIDKVEKAIDSTEKINLDSLVILAQHKDAADGIISDDEINAKVKKKIDRTERSVKVLEKITASSINRSTVNDNQTKEELNGLDSKSSIEAHLETKLDDGQNKSSVIGDSDGSLDETEMKRKKLPEKVVEDISKSVKDELTKAKRSLENNNPVEALESLAVSAAKLEEIKVNIIETEKEVVNNNDSEKDSSSNSSNKIETEDKKEDKKNNYNNEESSASDIILENYKNESAALLNELDKNREFIENETK